MSLLDFNKLSNYQTSPGTKTEVFIAGEKNRRGWGGGGRQRIIIPNKVGAPHIERKVPPYGMHLVPRRSRNFMRRGKQIFQ